MTYANAMQGLGAGMMQGLELHRRHRFEDDESQNRRQLMEQRTEAHGLNMNRGRMMLEHEQETLPMRREAAGLNLNQAHRQDRSGNRDEQAQEAALASQNAIRGLMSGDFNALNEWAQQINPEGAAIYLPGSEPGMILMQSMDGEEMEAPLQEVVRYVAQMANPQAVMDSAMSPQQEEWHKLNDGALYERRSGRAKGLDGQPFEPGAGGFGAGADIPTAEYNLAERVAHRFWGSMNEDGQFFLPEGSQENYALTLDRAGELMRAGIPVTQATRIAAMSIRGPMSEADAMKVAENESREQDGLNRRERRQYARDRVPEIMQESREAERQYLSLVGGQQMGDRQQGLQAPGSRQQGMRGPAGAAPQGAMRPPVSPDQRQRAMDEATEGLPPGWSVTGDAGRGGAPQSARPQRRALDTPMINNEGLRDTPGANLRRGVGQAIDDTSEAVRPYLQESYRALSDELIQPALKPSSAIVGRVAGGARFVRDFVSPGADPRAIPPAVFTVQSAMQSGDDIDVSTLQRAIDYAAENPKALTPEGRRALVEYAEQKGL